MQLMVKRMDSLWPLAQAEGFFDNGCGTGSIIGYILDTYGPQMPETTKVLAGDFSDPMLDVLRATKQDRINSSNDLWTRLDVLNIDAHTLLGVDDNSLSHVTGGHVYFLLADPRKALTETNRVLCRRGVLGMTSGHRSQHIEAIHDAMEAVRPGTNLQLLQEPWCSERGVRGELEATGFVDIETFLVETTMNYHDRHDFADTMLTMPVMKNATEDFSDEEKTQFKIHLADAILKADPENMGTLSGVGIVAIGRKSG